ncbi:MAG: hypothetical protein K6G15_10555 [Desulfovibrio sp.]|nr:hypothetical protein [Desulfovibrio sp.]
MHQETPSQSDNGRSNEQKWYEGKNKEIVIYYLIAVFFLEIIAGTAAFFYGVAHPIAQTAGGPKLANFPWVGWVISAVLVPVGLLLLFHLSGWFFTRSLNPEPSGKTKDSDKAIPKNIEMFYSVVSNAPVIVILLGLLALGGVLFFLDTALGTLRPYIPWILGSATVFLIICYIARLVFLAKHHRMEREYAYRMQVFEKTGIVITDKDALSIPLKDLAALQNSLPSGEQEALPEAQESMPKKDDDIVDADIVHEEQDADDPTSEPNDRANAERI